MNVHGYEITSCFLNVVDAELREKKINFTIGRMFKQ